MNKQSCLDFKHTLEISLFYCFFITMLFEFLRSFDIQRLFSFLLQMKWKWENVLLKTFFPLFFLYFLSFYHKIADKNANGLFRFIKSTWISLVFIFFMFIEVRVHSPTYNIQNYRVRSFQKCIFIFAYIIHNLRIQNHHNPHQNEEWEFINEKCLKYLMRYFDATIEVLYLKCQFRFSIE